VRMRQETSSAVEEEREWGRGGGREEGFGEFVGGIECSFYG
jgi:hypothetical protein